MRLGRHGPAREDGDAEPRAGHLDHGLRELDGGPASRLDAGRPEHESEDVELALGKAVGQEILARESRATRKGFLARG